MQARHHLYLKAEQNIQSLISEAVKKWVNSWNPAKTAFAEFNLYIRFISRNKNWFYIFLCTLAIVDMDSIHRLPNLWRGWEKDQICQFFLRPVNVTQEEGSTGQKCIGCLCMYIAHLLLKTTRWNLSYFCFEELHVLPRKWDWWMLFFLTKEALTSYYWHQKNAFPLLSIFICIV